MRRLALILCIASLALATPVLAAETNDHWPTWRGPAGTGEAPGSPPTEWGEGKNVAFKVDLPGLGSSTPVIWGDRLFLTVEDRNALGVHLWVDGFKIGMDFGHQDFSNLLRR